MARVLVVSKESFKSKDDTDLVYSNVSFVRLLLEEGVAQTRIHSVALAAYWVTFYNAEVRNGGFGQFVRNTKWQPKLISAVEKSLRQLADADEKARPHVDVFDGLVEYVDRVSKKDLRALFKTNADSYGTHILVRMLRFSGLRERFYELPQLTTLTAAFLRARDDLQVHPVAEMYKIAERVVGRTVARR